MEKSRTIHIINLGHYLENTPFAQDLLKHNMEMEPNMEWKIWTEKDPEIQEGIKSYTGPVSKNYIPYFAGAYLSHYILYHFGGIYCEMDYEFKINLLKIENDTLSDSETNDNDTYNSNHSNKHYLLFNPQKHKKNDKNHLHLRLEKSEDSSLSDSPNINY